jgi:hypothetical protein
MVAERTAPRVFVYHRNGRWAWIYEEDSMRLASNEDFGSVDAALHSATTAYPDVEEVEVTGPQEEDEPNHAGGRRWIPVHLRTVVLLLLASAGLYYVLRRRSRRRGRRVSGHG